MNVLIIPEDFTKDQYMLKPIVEAMLRAVGKPSATVRVCQDPRFHGIAQVLDWHLLGPVIDRYKGMIDLFLICVDRDGDANREASLRHIERQASVLAPNRVILAENAWQEIEVWVLAGHTNLPRGWNWRTIRQELHPKENYYLPFATRRGVQNEIAEGRKTLAQEAARHYDRIRRRCPEDIANLQDRLAQSLR